MSELIKLDNQEDKVITLYEICKLLEVRHNDSMAKVEILAKEPDFGELEKTRISHIKGKEIETFEFTKIQAIVVGAKLNNALLMKLVIKLEGKPKTQLELAREQVALLERLEQVEQEKQYAIETKAWISDKETATAMNTASQYSKENTALKIKLDEHKLYSTIRRQEKANKCKFAWRPLEKYCLENGLTIKEVDDDLYETVKSYPAQAWSEVYGVGFIR